VAGTACPGALAPGAGYLGECASVLDLHLGGHSTQLLSFARYYCTSRLLCTNQLFFYSPLPPGLRTLVQYYCAAIGQYTDPSRLYAIHHTILVITIACKGQLNSMFCRLVAGFAPYGDALGGRHRSRRIALGLHLAAHRVQAIPGLPRYRKEHQQALPERDPASEQIVAGMCIYKKVGDWVRSRRARRVYYTTMVCII